MAVRDRTVLPPEDDERFRALVQQFQARQTPELVLPDGSRIKLPEEVATVLRDVVEAMAQGKAVTVAPQHTTLTTQQAADLLGISRPTLVKLLEDGKIPFTKPGRHRRIRLSDVLAYRELSRRARERGLDELVGISEDLGLYDDGGTETTVRR